MLADPPLTKPKVKHLRVNAKVSRVTYPTWLEVVSGVTPHVPLSRHSQWNKKDVAVHRHNGTDETVFPVTGRVRDRTRKTVQRDPWYTRALGTNTASWVSVDRCYEALFDFSEEYRPLFYSWI